MATRTRISLELTTARKRVLERKLSQMGLSFGQWLDIAADDLWQGAYPVQGVSELGSLADLESPKRVFETLKSVDWAFTDAATNYLSHDIHPYPAKFIPQIPRTLIAKLSLPGETVFDPFGGSGTTALEAILMGRRAVSSDIHPISRIIGNAKTVTLTPEQDSTLTKLAERLAVLAEQPAEIGTQIRRAAQKIATLIPPIPNMSAWFHENAVSELAYLRAVIGELDDPGCAAIALVAFSKSILRASYQDEETRYASRPREVATGEVLRLFVTNLRTALRKARSLGPLLRFRTARFEVADARDLPLSNAGIAPNSVDLIVSSPPYPNCNDYHLYHRFRLFWLGFDPRTSAQFEIGSHLRHQKEGTGFEEYIAEMGSCLFGMIQVLRPGRFAVMVLGDGIFRGELYDTAEHVGHIAKRAGFQVLGTILREIHPTKRSFIPAARRARTEKLLVLRKPPRNADLLFRNPPYTLWPYERVLQRLEVEALLGRDSRDTDCGVVVPGNSLQMDRAKRVTFAHSIESEIGSERSWQAVLENGDASSSRRKDPKYVTHGIHPYKGKFYPQLAKALFNVANVSPGQTVLDPFCGSGTVLLEALLNGLRGIGTDLNVLAVKIARVKVEVLEVDAYLRDRLLADFIEVLNRQPSIEDEKLVFASETSSELMAWFPKPVLRKLSFLLKRISEVPEPRVRELLEVLLSSIVRNISQQEPKDLRIRRRKEPISDAPVFELLCVRVQEIRRRLQEFANRETFAPAHLIPARAVEGDCRRLDALTTATKGMLVDAVVTSPPYATALPYIDTDRLSILLLFGMQSQERARLEQALIGSREIQRQQRSTTDQLIDSGDFSGIESKTARTVIAEVRRRNAASDGGFRKQNTAALLYGYFRDMSVVLQNVNATLRPNGNAFFVVGDNKTCAGGKEVRVPTGTALTEIAASVGFKVMDPIPITVTTENRFNIKNSITENVILWFRRSS